MSATHEHKRAVLEALRKIGPATNKQVRAAIYGAGDEELDRAGCATTQALCALKRDGWVVLDGSPRRWRPMPGVSGGP